MFADISVLWMHLNVYVVCVKGGLSKGQEIQFVCLLVCPLAGLCLIEEHLHKDIIQAYQDDPNQPPEDRRGNRRQIQSLNLESRGKL
ncbi:hypothetical protein ILYODFUR_003516 [Ilyodon furcidens]|uniref:Uncharacterized protein n=1 Tax=Ilyodon furcidens TaxID=33524 RepID=A0ABV0UZZ3_9TELE